MDASRSLIINIIVKLIYMKKSSPNWNIAATHYLTAGFAIPMFFVIVAGFVLVQLGVEAEPLSVVSIFTNILWLVSIWLGVMYSASYLAKNYIIVEASKIVVLSTIYRVILTTLFIGGGIIFAVISEDAVLATTPTLEMIVSSIFGTILFYIASSRYVKSDGFAQ